MFYYDVRYFIFSLRLQTTHLPDVPFRNPSAQIRLATPSVFILKTPIRPGVLKKFILKICVARRHIVHLQILIVVHARRYNMYTRWTIKKFGSFVGTARVIIIETVKKKKKRGVLTRVTMTTGPVQGTDPSLPSHPPWSFFFFKLKDIFFFIHLYAEPKTKRNYNRHGFIY